MQGCAGIKLGFATFLVLYEVYGVEMIWDAVIAFSVPLYPTYKTALTTDD